MPCTGQKMEKNGSEVKISALFSYLIMHCSSQLTESLLSQNQAVNATNHFPSLLSLPPVLCHALLFFTPPVFLCFFTPKKCILRTSKQRNLIKVHYEVSSAFMRTDRKILMETVREENLTLKSHFWSLDSTLTFHRKFSIFFPEILILLEQKKFP